MINKFKILGVILLMGFITFGCDDFEETDISDYHVKLLAPPNKLVTKSTILTFWWDSINKAHQYNLQIVSKSFDQLEWLVIDTVLEDCKVDIGMPAGEYEWMVKAINGGSSACSDTFSFVINATTAQTSLTAPKKLYIKQ